MNKQSGNVLLWVILGIVAIGMGVVIVWRYFAATDAFDNAEQAEQTTVVRSKKVTQTVTVAEWGVRMGIPDSLQTKGVSIEYQAADDGGAGAAYYRSTALADANNTCLSPTEGKSLNQTFMIVTKYNENTESERERAAVNAEDIAHVGDAYYFVSTPDIKDCYVSGVITPFINDSVRQTIVDSIKAAE